mmetsp:Transcript_26285/g.53230  ORF Transcript_26285/g.53230 Transcript_26285/m.53230 type:complete len:294 (-) Transcript_26285:64-945(-)
MAALLAAAAFLAGASPLEAAEGARIKLIGAGLSRTGTASLFEALEVLGYRSTHGATLAFNRTADREFHVAMRRVHPDGEQHIRERDNHMLLGKAVHESIRQYWESMAQGGITAVLDTPFNLFYQELMQIYPDAKVVLTIRSTAEEWYESSHAMWRAFLFLRSDCSDILFGRTPYACNMCAKSHDAEMRSACIETYYWHIRRVKASVPAGRLLVFNVSDGWEPLCHFLGVPVPDRPFPHNNRASELPSFKTWIAGGLCVVALCVWCCLKCLCRCARRACPRFCLRARVEEKKAA